MRPPESDTPEEALEAAYFKMRAGLTSEVLARVKASTPEFFERLVVELLLKMGYGGSRKDTGHAIGKSGDEVMIDIHTGTVLRGSLSSRALSLIDEWRNMHIDELMDNWERARRREPLVYIAPLE